MMECRLSLFEGHAFLGGRAVAFRMRTAAEQWLKSHNSGMVVLDFNGVSGVSHSCADELLSSLTDTLGADLPRRVSLTNCAASVYADLETVAEMHGLGMPSVCKGFEVQQYA